MKPEALLVCAVLVLLAACAPEVAEAVREYHKPAMTSDGDVRIWTASSDPLLVLSPDVHDWRDGSTYFTIAPTSTLALPSTLIGGVQDQLDAMTDPTGTIRLESGR